MKILITGSRDWPKEARGEIWAQIIAALPPDTTPENELIAGDCKRGVDAHVKFFAEIIPKLGREAFTFKEFEADWDTHDRAAGPIRNQEMVDYGADICLAFLCGPSVGTRDCRKRALLANIPVRSFALVGNRFFYVPNDYVIPSNSRE